MTQGVTQQIVLQHMLRTTTPRCDSLPASPARTSPAAPGNYEFLASNGKLYLLSTFKRTWQDAEAFCQTRGGHLVGYKSASEQRTVEQQFISDGYLLPSFHGAYYVGLTDDGTSWSYSDYFYKSSAYIPWDARSGWPRANQGTLAVANMLTPRNGIFAFNNNDGTSKYVHICIISRGWLAASCLGRCVRAPPGCSVWTALNMPSDPWLQPPARRRAWRSPRPAATSPSTTPT